MSIEIKDLQFYYQKGTPYEKEALRHIDLTIDDGEFVAIIGHTGSGKSTLGQHLNGILRPNSGSVKVNGLDVADKKTRLLSLVRQVGLSFQYPEHQLFAATVWEEVEIGPRNLGYSEAKIKSLTEENLHRMGLLAARDQSPFALSGGEQRRLALAAVLAMDTPILVLDEPTVGLDPRGRREIGDFILQLQREEKKTVVWIGHDMGEIARLAQRLVVMDKGRVAMDGSVREIFGRYRELSASGICLPDPVRVVAALREAGKPVAFPLLDEEEVYAAISHWLEGSV